MSGRGAEDRGIDSQAVDFDLSVGGSVCPLGRDAYLLMLAVGV